jgi:hypothetical protein
MLDNDLLNPLGDVAHAMISSIDTDNWLCSAWPRRPFADLAARVRRRGP